MSPTASPTSNPKPSQKREHLVQTALRLFYQQGFHATGVEQLAQEAGTTKRTLYSHFNSKEDLIMAALQLRDTQFMEALQNALAAEPPQACMSAYINFLIHWSQNPHFNGCAFIHAAGEYAQADHPIHQFALTHKTQVKAHLHARLEEAGAHPAKKATLALFLLGEGYIVASQINRSPFHANQTRKLAQQLAQQFGLAP